MSGGPLLVNDSNLPTDWLRQGLGIEDIVRLRAQTIRGISKVAPYIEPIQEIALAPRPVTVEASLDRRIRFNPDFDRVTAPVGCLGNISRLDILNHPGTDHAVDRVTSDPILMPERHASPFTSRRLTYTGLPPLSLPASQGKNGRSCRPGGQSRQWTTLDLDRTGKGNFTVSGGPGCPASSHGLFGNRIAVILIPGDWRYRMIERWGPRSLWAGETESIVRDGEAMKKTGYLPITGAYYSARLAVTEHLVHEWRCARAIVIRNVEPSYWAPLGTWVVREATRLAMAAEPLLAPSLAEAIGQAGVYRISRVVPSFCPGPGNQEPEDALRVLMPKCCCGNYTCSGSGAGHLSSPSPDSRASLR